MRCLYILALLAITLTTRAQENSDATPVILGQTLRFYSNVLKETRAVNVYLPPEYQQNDTATFPVVYLLDGGMDEDFLHICGLYQFDSFSWIKRVKPSIIIGIVNKDRLRDMTFATGDSLLRSTYPHSGGSAKFILFIEKELQPFIKEHFRTSSEKSLIGQSLGGLLAAEVLIKKPALFTQYMIVSPSLWWDNGSLLQYPFKMPDAHTSEVFIAVGREGLTPGPHPRVMEVDARLLAEKITEAGSGKSTVCFDYLPDEDHATILHQAIYNALRKVCDCAAKH